MASIDIQNVKKAYGHVQVLHDIDLRIKDGEFVVLVGPSGCGKSTLLRMIAGLEDISGGEIRIAESRVNELHPKDRDIAMVFQSYALYPHMNVAGNMSYSLRLRKMAKDSIAKAVANAAAKLGLDPLLERRPKALSGGQRQRVAMGRAIVRQPKAALAGRTHGRPGQEAALADAAGTGSRAPVHRVAPIAAQPRYHHLDGHPQPGRGDADGLMAPDRIAPAVADSPTTLYVGLGHTQRFPDYWELFSPNMGPVRN